MASQGGNLSQVTSSADVPALITAAVKAAQRPAGLVVPPSTVNDSMYGATGPWHEYGGAETVRLPAFRFTIKRRSGRGTSSFVLSVSEPGFPIYSTAGSLHRHATSYRKGYYEGAVAAIGHDTWHRMERVGGSFTKQWKKVHDDIEKIAGSFNYDKSDIQSDYFNNGFYFEVRPSPDLQAKSYATSERLLSALEAAFPDRWARIVVQAAEEESNAAHHESHFGESPNDVSTRFRSELDRDIRRALESVREGVIAIPFDPDRRGWRPRHSKTGIEYYLREKKLKVGNLVGYVSAMPGKSLSADGNGETVFVGPEDYDWVVKKLTGGRGGIYRARATLDRNVADSIENAIRAAEQAMGIQEAPAGEAL